MIFDGMHKEEYEKYQKLILAEYFFDPHGIHGVLHTQRVLKHSILLAGMNNLSSLEKNILYTAVAYHDIGRTCDGIDPAHGLEGWKKAKRLGLIKMQDMSHTAIMRYVITNHSLDDDCIHKHQDGQCPDTAKLYLQLMKDADALDRVRINDLDERYLRNQYSKSLVHFAQELFYSDNNLRA